MPTRASYRRRISHFEYLLKLVSTELFIEEIAILSEHDGIQYVFCGPRIIYYISFAASSKPILSCNED